MSRIENATKIVEAIELLRQEEGDMITIVNDNPDFYGTNSLVFYANIYKEAVDQSFDGDNLLECLEKAVKALGRNK
jgi:hypothetical protein